MDKLTQWVAFTVLGCLALLAAGWFLLISPQRVDAAELRTQAAAQENANATARAQLVRLQAQARDLPQKQAELAQVAAKIPAMPDLASLVRALNRASASAGVRLVTIAPGPAVAVVATTAAVPAPAAAPAPAEGAPAAGAPAAPAVGATAALSKIPLTLNAVGSYYEVQNFLGRLENLERALRVTALTLAPGADPLSTQKSTTDASSGESLAATITAEVYLSAPPAATAAVPVPPAAVPATPAQ